MTNKDFKESTFINYYIPVANFQDHANCLLAINPARQAHYYLTVLDTGQLDWGGGSTLGEHPWARSLSHGSRWKGPPVDMGRAPLDRGGHSVAVGEGTTQTVLHQLRHGKTCLASAVCVHHGFTSSFYDFSGSDFLTFSEQLYNITTVVRKMGQ